MMSRVICPACQHKFMIPEGEMGSRQVCPNCQSPFLAGKTEAGPSMLSQAAEQPRAGYDKTMLAGMEPPIKYNCPRCRTPLESPVSEAGTKKPCPACGQRLQVPAAPPPAPVAVQSELARTMLASDESQAPPLPPIKYNCPRCKKPLESPASDAGTKKNCPACNQRLQVPAAPTASVNKTMMATHESQCSPAGYASFASPSTSPAATTSLPAPPQPMTIGSVPVTPRNMAIASGVLLFLLIVVPAVIRGGTREDTAALARAQQELEKLKNEIKQRESDLDRLAKLEAETRRQLDEMRASIREQDAKIRADHLQALSLINDANKRAELEAKHRADMEERERRERAREKQQQEMLEKLQAEQEAARKALEAAKQQTQTIIQQPPPVIYYPPYHPRYYYWWW